MSTEEELFKQQCSEAGKRITAVLFGYPKPITMCVLFGVLASVMKTFDIPRETAIAMLDSVLDDIGDA